MKRRITALRSAASSLAERIRQARELIGLSRADLARRIGVGPSAAVQWENPNGTSPSVQHLIEIASVTDVAFEWLATGRGPARTGGGLETPALKPEAYAHDLFEEQMLMLARNVPLKHRDALMRYLETVYK